MYQSAPFWKYETSVFILFSVESVNRNNHQAILEQFSEAGIFNVAIVQQIALNSIDLIYHRPFSSKALKPVRNPTNWRLAFPNKIKNLHGKEITLLAKSDPPGVIIKDADVYGTDKSLFDVILKQWNATYKVIPVQAQYQYKNVSILKNLMINRFPFFTSIIRLDCEYVQAFDTDQVRIMVRYRKTGSTSKILGTFLKQRFVILHLSVFISYFCLHYIFFHRKRDVFCMSYVALAPLTLKQSSPVKTPTTKEKIFLAAGLWYAFFVVSRCECEITSEAMANVVEPKIQTIDELVKSDYHIFTSIQIYTLLTKEHYNLTEEFLEKLQVVDEIPWQRSYRQVDYAYVISMADNKMFLNSPLNVDEYGLERFYFLDHIITTVPMVFLFPHHSPYKRTFHMANLRINEARLIRYWGVRNMKMWSIWKVFQQFDGSIMRESHNYNLYQTAYHLLMLGWIMGGISCIFEILWARRGAVAQKIKSRLGNYNC